VTEPEEAPPRSAPGVAQRLWRIVPRLVLNSAGPLVAFYLGSRAVGTVGGIVAATVTSLVLFGWERRQGRPGMLARLSLAVVVLQATAGLIAGSAALYFLPKVTVDLVQGVAFFLSCLTRRPLAGAIAGEFVTVPQRMLGEPAVRRVFVRLTLLWATYFTVRGLICLAVLVTASTQTFLLVRALIDAPVVIPLLAVSLRYGMRNLSGRLGSPPGDSDARHVDANQRGVST
jgi:intracellular septation protein A